MSSTRKHAIDHSAPLPLGQLKAIEKAIELRDLGETWSWPTIADTMSSWTLEQLRKCRERLDRFAPPSELDDHGLMHWYLRRAGLHAKELKISEQSFANRAREEYRVAPGKNIERMGGNHGVGPKLRAALFARDGIACVWCGSEDDPQADHIHPAVDGWPDEARELAGLVRPLQPPEEQPDRNKLVPAAIVGT